MAAAILTAERLRELLDYDPDTGVFTRKKRTAQRHQVGDRADLVITGGRKKGCYRIALDSTKVLAHRAVWLYVFGEWPKDEIDHIDVDCGNNRIGNLRDVSGRVNHENIRKPRSNNTSGYLGVTFDKGARKWSAKIQVAKKTQHLGLYETPEAAFAVYLAAKRRFHEGCTI